MQTLSHLNRILNTTLSNIFIEANFPVTRVGPDGSDGMLAGIMLPCLIVTTHASKPTGPTSYPDIPLSK